MRWSIRQNKLDNQLIPISISDEFSSSQKKNIKFVHAWDEWKLKFFYCYLHGNGNVHYTHRKKTSIGMISGQLNSVYDYFVIIFNDRKKNDLQR